MKISSQDLNEYLSRKSWFNGAGVIYLNNETCILKIRDAYSIVFLRKIKDESAINSETVASKTIQGALAISLIVSLRDKNRNRNTLSAYEAMSEILKLNDDVNDHDKFSSHFSSNEDIIEYLIANFKYHKDDDKETLRRAVERIVG